MNIQGSKLNIISLLYIYIPIWIFLIGWCEWYVYIPCCVASIGVLYGMLKAYNVDSDSVRVNKYVVTFSILFLLITAYYLGWGRFTTQMNDYGKHNGVLNDLTMRSWPVVYKDIDGHLCMLTYYLGQYLVSAFIGKLFSSYRVAEIVMAIWAFFGLILVYFHLLKALKGEGRVRPVVILLALILFSPPLAVAKSIIFRATGGMDFAGEWFWYSDNLKLQYSSNWGLLQWVFPQVLVPWLITLLFMNNVKKVEYYVPLLLPALLYGAFPFLGLVLYAFIFAIYFGIQAPNKMDYLKNLFGLPNILMSLTLGLVLILYLLGNVLEPKPSEISFRLLDYSENWVLLPFFEIVMSLLYAILIYKEHRNNPWYYATILFLLIFPLFSMGLMNDFTMRCSIPALFILMYLILQFLFDGEWKHDRLSIIRCTLLVSLLLFSTKWPLRWLQDQVKTDDITALSEDKSYVTMEQFTDRDDSYIRVDRRYNYFTYDVEQSIFLRYIAREPYYNSELHFVPGIPHDQKPRPSVQE